MKRKILRAGAKLAGLQFFVLFLLFNLFVNTVFGQASPIKFTVLTTKDGMSSNTVNSIIKDHFGLLWIATPEGLDRFDGKYFKIYRFSQSRNASFESLEVVALLEDKKGRLWVGTLGGSLFIYDREKDKFENFFSGKEGTTLMGINIAALCSDYMGNIWVGTDNGINIVNPETRRVKKFLPTPHSNNQLNLGDVRCLFEDKVHQMWVGTNDGLYRFNRKKNNFDIFRHHITDPKSLAGDSVDVIQQDYQGNLWIGTTNGLSKMEERSISFTNYHYNPLDSNSISGNRVYTIVPSDNQTLWIGTEGGLDIMNINSGKLERYHPNARENYSINSKSIRCIYIDPQGISWIGTYNGGINKYDKNLTLFNVKQNREFDPMGLNAPFVTAFAEAERGDIFIATDGGGLNVFHSKTGFFSHIDIRSGKKLSAAGLPILTMIKDHTGLLWIGTFDHGLFTYDPQTKQARQYLAGTGPYDINHDQIFCLKEDRDGNIWIGTNGKGIDVFDRKSKKFIKYLPYYTNPNGSRLPLNGYIRAIEQDKSGDIWIGSVGSGLAIYHSYNQKFTVLTTQQKGVPLNRILSFYQDPENTMWIGTSGEGLFCYNTYKHQFTSFSEADGLPNGVIHKILSDINGDLWMSTNRGLSKLDRKSKKFTNYTPYNGLQSNSFFDGSGLVSSNGTVFFGGVEGFNYFDTKDIKINRNIPGVLLTGLKVNNIPVSAGAESPLKKDILIADQIDLNYKQDFAISFIALNFTSPQQNQYSYRMKGFNKNWVDAGSQNTANYTNLDPGEYTFMVKASNNDGLWNDTGKSIKVIIHPPFWRTYYAYCVYVILFFSSLFLIRKRGIEKLQTKFDAEKRKHEIEKMHELDLMKIKFLTNLSHEFRTPISLIIAPADQLLAHHHDNQTSAQLNLIKRNARRLLNLVNQLLDFRKMEENELKLVLTDGEIVSYVKDITDGFQDLAEAKKISLIFESIAKILLVRFDHEKIERILFNLLSNAFKFTPSGGLIKVSLSTDRSTNNDDESLSIQVTDTGIGIADDKKNLIFDRFFQDDHSPANLNQGSGIGLSITKEFVVMHGGSIDVMSEPDKGSTFIVKIPLSFYAPSTDTPPVGKNESVIDHTVELPKATVKKPKSFGMEILPHILIVEDDDDFRRYLSDNLKYYYKVSEAINGREGWHKALSVHPELIVSDVTMPYLDGIGLTRKLKGDKRTTHIPIILLTALARENHQLEGLETGANDYLTKPFNFDILNAKISNLLKLNLDLKTAYTKQLKVTPSDVNIESSDAKFLNKIILYIEENLSDTKLSVEDISHYLGMSRGALYSRMLLLTGQPPVEFIRSFKLERAAKLLAESDFNIAQVAYKVGFATPHYFTKSFKAKYNMLPSEYRLFKSNRV